MRTHRPGAASPTASGIQRDTPSPAATDLAHAMLNSGWTLTGATVRVIHTARLTEDSGLTVAVSCEAGKVRLDFDSEYRHLGGYQSRSAWHAEASRELPVAVLTAIAAANAAASDEDPTDVGEALTSAGWSQPDRYQPKWISPGRDREVALIDDLVEDSPLPWQIHHMAGRPVTVHASDDTPAAVILAFALVDTAPAVPCRADRTAAASVAWERTCVAMPHNGSTGEAFLAELTALLTGNGWTRHDRNHFAITTPEFTHPNTPAVLTITGTAWPTPSAFLLYDDVDTCWRVACDNPQPAALAAAANATLISSTSHDEGRRLEELLRNAGWASEQEPDDNDRIYESRWTSPDGNRTVCLPRSAFGSPGWLTYQAVTATGVTTGHYTPSRTTPTAVLAALALTATPNTGGPAQSDAPDTTA